MKNTLPLYLLIIFILALSSCAKTDSKQLQNNAQTEENASTQNENLSEHELLKKIEGYWYNEEYLKLIYLTSDADSFYRYDKTVYLSANTVTSDSYGMSPINGQTVQNFLATLKEKGIVSYLGNTYERLPVSEENIPDFFRGLAVKRFAKTEGVYYDGKQNRQCTIKMQGNKISLTLGYEDGREESDTLEITEIETAEGQNGYSIYFENYKNEEVVVYKTSDKPEYDPYEGEEYYPRAEVFKFSTIPNLYPEWAQPLELKWSTYTVGYGKLTRISISNPVRIYDGKEITEEKSFAIYRGKDGYALLVLPNKTYRIIDGQYEQCIFDAEDKTTGFVEKADFPLAASNCGIISNLKASSSLTDKNHTYSADNMIGVYSPRDDSNRWLKNNIPWAEGKDDDGIGETIDFDLSPTSDHRMVAVNLTILNGYVDPLKPHLFYENNRVKTMLVTTNEGESVTIHFNDVVEFTTIQLPVTTTHVTLTIQEVYKGSKYSDTCISALDANHQLWDK